MKIQILNNSSFTFYKILLLYTIVVLLYLNNIYYSVYSLLIGIFGIVNYIWGPLSGGPLNKCEEYLWTWFLLNGLLSIKLKKFSIIHFLLLLWGTYINKYVIVYNIRECPKFSYNFDFIFKEILNQMIITSILYHTMMFFLKKQRYFFKCIEFYRVDDVVQVHIY